MRLENEEGRARFGECAPLPRPGSGSVDEAAGVCAAPGSRVSDAQIDAITAHLGCLGFALQTANNREQANNRGQNNKGQVKEVLVE